MALGTSLDYLLPTGGKSFSYLLRSLVLVLKTRMRMRDIIDIHYAFFISVCMDAPEGFLLRNLKMVTINTLTLLHLTCVTAD